ncbi:kinase [Cordyceps militaris]|uniref:Isopentenyl phosphate kinase n=1 Tax=Cordyceps militaris TaxID=73501 RepID=A0A2H4S7L3_CORMI|nr:kinase [Cordyceps militaris]
MRACRRSLPPSLLPHNSPSLSDRISPLQPLMPDAPMSIVVVKLGGAAITDKSDPDTLSPSIDALMDGIAHAYHQVLRPSGRRLILVHGAGSFGHPPAKKYQVKAGWTAAAGSDEAARDRVKFGMALTRQRVLELHLAVLQRLHAPDRGMPVLSVSTYDTVETDGGLVGEASGARLEGRVRQVLDAGFVPLLFGDAVLDRSLGSTILSGDALVYHLAARMPAVRRCVFVTDVAGIFTQDPKRCPDAVLIRTMGCREADGGGGGALDADDAASVDDVTGSMRSKWQWAKRIVTDALQVREVAICQASDSARAIGHEQGDESDAAGDWTVIVR